MLEPDRRRFLLDLDDLTTQERRKILKHFSDSEQKRFDKHWRLWARPEQMPPAHGDWHTWLVCAGRGFGKTRAGAEWVRQVARADGEARIALVGASLAEARAVMVEGESGIMACCSDVERPAFAPSLGRLEWPNGAQAQLYSAAEPEGLRGPQFSHAWCDEIGKWALAGDRAQRAWDNLVMAIRLGDRPLLVATTTPRAVPLVKDLIARAETDEQIVVTRGSTYDNVSNLPQRFVNSVRRRYAKSALGRQELDGELLADVEGALWNRALLEQCREDVPSEACARIVVGVDPPASANGDACGIVVCGVTESGVGKVLCDASIAKPSPERWARAVARAARAWNADRVVAEANQGGAMVASVLRAAEYNLPLKLVHASRGKVARAEPVAALYEAGRVRHTQCFPKLEDELCGLMSGGDYRGPGRSPDRADALVWALTELMLGRSGRPRVSGF